ncbi:hypothetical protein HPB52_015093 [Rhipicephalus sanguineus]|uniref:Uncharacterized protein n=1 Tax=Rhipicephalus sanguineus TaxID=34632 RepID=A0A9D4T4J9_RHISA|nr:hypothetical protein HPB52_015093 [Rhipicephalus sanguineus]
MTTRFLGTSQVLRKPLLRSCLQAEEPHTVFAEIDVQTNNSKGCILQAQQWATLFSEYTEGFYEGNDRIQHYERSTTIIKRLFEDKDVGKVGLRYLVAWSIYRQLANFTDPYLMRGYKKADEACFLIVKDVMCLAILSHYFQKLSKVSQYFVVASKYMHPVPKSQHYVACHKAERAVRAYLEELGAMTSDRPPIGADININENAWGIIESNPSKKLRWASSDKLRCAVEEQ